jgi:hypothetical protein
MRWIALAAGTIVPLVAGHELARAQQKTVTPSATPAPAPSADAAAQPAPAASAPEREPAAIAALVKMGTFLQTLRSFAVHADTTTDEVLLSGQKIQLSSSADLRAKRPDRLRFDVHSDRKERQTYYDGKTLTQYAPRVNYYASIPAPATIRGMLDLVADKYDVQAPLADLFYWGTDAAPIAKITSALEIGPARVGDVQCDQYAFRQGDTDWQIWIQRGQTPLPRKLLITTLDEPSQPQSTSTMQWDLTPNVDEDAFVFRPPQDAMKIVFAAAPGK